MQIKFYNKENDRHYGIDMKINETPNSKLPTLLSVIYWEPYRVAGDGCESASLYHCDPQK